MKLLKNSRNRISQSRNASRDYRDFDNDSVRVYGVATSKRGRRRRRRRFTVDDYGVNGMLGLVNGEQMLVDSHSVWVKGYDTYDFL
jgi:hypothetical protein